MSADALGDRQKSYEMAEAGRKLMPLLPVMVRLDGRGFSRFTKGMQRPFDPGMVQLMADTTKYLVENTGAILGYCQSDEITLVLYTDNYSTELFFGSRIQKLTSVLASMCTAYFNRNLPDFFPNKKNMATFDCRVWNVPTLEEAANAVLWRERDATKNSITMACSHYYSHKELFKKHQTEQHDMLHAKGINWNDYPSAFKRGTYVRRVKTMSKFTPEELAQLPAKHNAHKNPDLVVERSRVEFVEFPPFGSVQNRVGVIFFGEDPDTGNIV